MRKKHSYFKNSKKDQQTFRTWLQRLEQTNGYAYEQYTLKTSLDNTQVYGLNTAATDLEWSPWALPIYSTTSCPS